MIPKDTQEGEYLQFGSHQTAATPYSELKGAQDVEKCRILAPQLRYV